jgi:hypothetical protein
MYLHISSFKNWFLKIMFLKSVNHFQYKIGTNQICKTGCKNQYKLDFQFWFFVQNY